MRPDGPGPGRDAQGGAGGDLQVQPAARRGTRHAAGRRRGGAARALRLPALDQRLGRYQLPEEHHGPFSVGESGRRPAQQQRVQPTRLYDWRGAAAVSRLPHGECGECRGSDGARRVGNAAYYRGIGAAGGRYGLRRRRARHGDRALAREQRDGAHPRSAGDAGPLQRRRSHAHRRRPGAGAPGCRRGGSRSGQGQPQDQPRHLRARGRPSAEPSGGGAGNQPHGQERTREHRDFRARKPGRGRGALPRAVRALRHRPDQGRAVADRAARGQLHQALRSVGSQSTRRKPRWSRAG